MALASDRPTLGKWKWKFPQLAEISDSGRTCATLLLEYFRYWFYNVNRRWLIGSSWGRWNFATIEVKCSLGLRMETCFERWWWEIVNWVVSEAERSDKWVKRRWYFMFVMVFVEHILWGEIVFKGKRILVWLVYLSPSQYLKLGLMYGMVAVKHTFGLQEVQKCVLKLPSHIWQKTRLWK